MLQTTPTLNLSAWRTPKERLRLLSALKAHARSGLTSASDLVRAVAIDAGSLLQSEAQRKAALDVADMVLRERSSFIDYRKPHRSAARR